MKKQINVVGAVIVQDERILCARRGLDGSLPGMWEFPGGKLEAGETPREALEREIAEELLCQVTVGDEVTTTAYEYDFGIVNLTTFYCDLIGGTPHLTEHIEIAWSEPHALGTYDWAPADVPAVNLIKERFASCK